MKPSVNLDPKWIGCKFGKLTVVGVGYDSVHQNYTWKCVCDCGNMREVKPGNAKAGRVRSCGCAQLEAATTHGQRYTRLYGIWAGMRRRCRDEKHNTYPNYGGRGITVCEQWSDFTVFREWAINHGYTDALSIDRLDVNGNYEPMNCRWATATLQCRNRRSNRIVTVFGEKQTLIEAITKYGNGIHFDTVAKRIDKYGYSVEDAIITPVRA